MYGRAKPRPHLAPMPREHAVLGEAGLLVLHDPNARNGGGRFFEWEPAPGSILTSDEEGRQLWILCPRVRGEEPRPTDRALRAGRLFARFTHTAADAFYNAIVPAPRRPRFAGEVALLRYSAAKDPGAFDLDDDDTDDRGVTEYEHYFEEPGRRPAYPQAFQIGHAQIWIPPGPFDVKAAGIAYADPPTRS